MKILVMSDSHRVLNPIRDLLETTHQGIDMVFHLGDCSEDIKSFIKIYNNIEFHCINGNCDFNDHFSYEEIIIVNGKKIWLSHGHRNGVKIGYDRISYAAEEKEVQVCLFGHTHMPATFKYNDIWFMNPGSLSFPRGIAIPSYGVLDITDSGDIECRLVGIYGKKVYRPLDI